MNDPKSTNEIRLIAQDVTRQQSEVCEERRQRITDRVGNLDDRTRDHEQRIEALNELRVTVNGLHTKALNDLCVTVEGLRAQIRVTWALLLLVISGLVGVAFSMWQQ